MSPSKGGTPAPSRTEPIGPLGLFFNDFLNRNNLKYDPAAELVNDAARKAGEPNTHFDRFSVRNWIRGSIPKPQTRPWIVAGLGMSAAELAAAIDRHDTWRRQERRRAQTDKTAHVPPSTTTAHASAPPQHTSTYAYTPAVPVLTAELEAEMKRRTFARYLAFAGGVAFLRPDIIAAVLDGSSPIDDALADRLQSRSLRYMEQWDRLPPHVLLATVVGHLDEIQLTLTCARPAPLVQRLRVIAAETAAFAGMLGWFIQDRGLAEINLSLADDYSRTTGHMPVQATVLAIRADFHSSVQLGRNVGSAISRTMLDAATTAAGTSPSPLRAWTLMRQAEEYAVIGNERQAYRLLELADTALAAVRSMPDGMFKHWNSDMHHAFRGNCEQLLGHHNRSIETLVPVLSRIEPAAVSNRIALQADIAAVHARQGEVEQSTTLLAQALSAASHAGLRERVRRVAGIRSEILEPFGNHPAVRNLDDQIQATLNAERSVP